MFVDSFKNNTQAKLCCFGIALSLATIITGIVAHQHMGDFRDVPSAAGIAMYSAGGAALVIISGMFLKTIKNQPKPMEIVRIDRLRKVVDNYFFDYQTDRCKVRLLTKEQIQNISVDAGRFFYFMEINSTGIYTESNVFSCYKLDDKSSIETLPIYKLPINKEHPYLVRCKPIN